MIRVKMMAKPKGGSSSTSGGGTYSGSVAEADYAALAGKAKRAEQADQATHADVADRALRADYATEAQELSDSAEILTRYLRKDIDDTAQGNLVFEKALRVVGEMLAEQGVSIGDGSHAIDKDGNATLQDVEGRNALFSDVRVDRVRDPKSTDAQRTIIGAQGFDLYMSDEDGRAHLYIDDLVVRNKLFASTLELRRISYSGGTTIFSNAGSTIRKVVYVFDEKGERVVAFKCYAKADDGETATANWWKPGMMAMCRTFNVKAGVYEDVANRYYWRLCVDAGQEVLDDGRTYDYVVLSNIAYFKGSELVQPDPDMRILADGDKSLLSFGGILIGIHEAGHYLSFAELLERDGITTLDDGGNVANHVFQGYDPAGTSFPVEGDVIVNVGDQVKWDSRGNVIKLATSTEDNGDDTAPSIMMYHAIGKPRSPKGGNLTVWLWEELTACISPKDVYFLAENFRFLYRDKDGNQQSKTAAQMILDSEKFEVSISKVTSDVSDVKKDVSAVDKKVDDANDDIKKVDEKVDTLGETVSSNYTKLSTSITQTAEDVKIAAIKQTKDDLKEAGLEVTADGVTLYGDKIDVKNGDTTAAMFEGGKLNANLIDADTIVANGIKTQELEARNLKVTDKSKIGPFSISDSGLYFNTVTSTQSLSYNLYKDHFTFTDNKNQMSLYGGFDSTGAVKISLASSNKGTAELKSGGKGVGLYMSNIEGTNGQYTSSYFGIVRNNFGVYADRGLDEATFLVGDPLHGLWIMVDKETGNISMQLRGLPTSSSGLSTGMLYNDNGTLKIKS